MKSRLIGLLGWILVLAGAVVGGTERERSSEATGFHLNLGLRNLEKDYVAMEEWVFEGGLEDEEWRKRVVDGVWALTETEDRHRYEEEKLVWVDRFLARLEREGADRWWVWLVIGRVLADVDGYGVMVDGEFRRGVGDWNERMWATERDEAKARRCLVRAMAMARAEMEAGRATGEDLAEVCVQLAGLFDLSGKRVLELTDLAVVPEISENSPWRRWSPDRFMVDGRNPVVGPEGAWRLPELRDRFEDAETDGERKYWLLHEAIEMSGGPGGSRTAWAEVRLKLALMWHGMLGADGLCSAGYVYLEGTESEFEPDAPGEFELHTLKDHETMVLGVDGPSRRVIPEHCRYLAVLRDLVKDGATPEPVREGAQSHLLEILANRNQFDSAEAVAKTVLARKGGSEDGREDAEAFLMSMGPDAMFNASIPFALGEEVKVEFISREISEQRFELWKLDVERVVRENVIREVKDLSSVTFGHSCWRLGQKDGDALRPYFERVSEWVVPIRMKTNHLQTVSRIEVPVTGVGNYVVVACLDDCRAVLPVQVSRSIVLGAAIEAKREEDDEGRGNFFVIDAVSGAPVEGAEVERVGWGPAWTSRAVSDYQGYLPDLRGGGVLVVRRPGMVPELVSVEGDWLRDPLDEREVRSLFVTNQPIYRPGQRVEFCGWLKRPNWRSRRPSRFIEGSEVRVRVTDPVGQIVYKQEHELDEFGGFAGSFGLGVDMVLGDCVVDLELSDLGAADYEDPFAEDSKVAKSWVDLGQQWYRKWTITVGEFRKPDFRVTVEAETGRDEFAAVVQASYQSGEPVMGALVKGRLRGTPERGRFFPKREWDGFYESGYAWGLPRAKWMEGWEEWGIWPEEYDDHYNNNFSYENAVTLMAEGVTDEKGRARLVFPKRLPLLGRYDYECDLRVGVEEFTGRSVGAETEFLFSEREFEVHAAPERGFYRSGEVVWVDLWTMSRERDPVRGEGLLRIEAVEWAGGDQVLRPVWEQRVVTGEDGRQRVEFVPPGAGQYRCVFAAGGGERGFLLEVLGDRKTPGRYDGVQMIAEHTVCRVGDEVEVLIQTEAAEAQVWFFDVMPDGRRRTPRLIETKDHVAVVTLPVLKIGMPQFSLHAAAVVDGRLRKSQTRIMVPPVESRLEVAMSARPAHGKPGQEAAVEVTVKDHAGKSADASLAVTVFDRALEDLTGPLPTAGDRIPERISDWGYHAGIGWIESSQDSRNWDDYVINRLDQPGVFSERGHLVGDPRWQPSARFERVGEHLWNGYHPPELPNSIGRNSDGGMGVFPVTPATPISYRRPFAAEAELSAEEKAGMAGVELRRNFADRAHWGVALRTDAEGRVRAEFELPDNLTAWRVQAWAFGKGIQFGDGQTEIVVAKDLQVRPLLPRSMVVGDELFVGAQVQNLSEKSGEFQVAMTADGVAVEGTEQVVRLGAGAEGRAEWKVRPQESGVALFRFRARSVGGRLTDGAEVAVPVSPRRVPVTVAAQGEIDERERDVRLKLKVREPVGGGKLQVRVEGNPALGALAVIPDLVNYPHGCAEQTLNRFLPTLIAWQAAEGLGLDWESMERSFGRDQWSIGWIGGRGGAVRKPANLTDDRVRGMIMVGLNRLSELQSDGGAWGWFSPDDQTNAAYLTALAVRGVALAGEHGFRLKDDPAKDGISWLRKWASEREGVLAKAPNEVSALDAFVVHVLAKADDDGAPGLRDVLLGLRERLNAAGLIHLALAMDGNEGDEMRRLFTAATEAMDPVKAGLVKGTGWWEDEVELRAWYLKLLVKMEADDVVLRSGIRGLLDKRSDGVRWKSTRDSSLCVEAIIEAALACGGFGLDVGETLEVKVTAAGVESELELSGTNLWSAQVTLPLDALAMSAREVPVVVRGDGKAALMAVAAVSYESDAAEAMGVVTHGIEVERRYFRVMQGVARQELKEGDLLKVGELVEVELRMNADEERAFVYLRDPIPAGLEPLVELSGYERGSYRESRTGETHFFLSELSAWNKVQRYHLRAVTRGTGLALPARAECMYAPAVFGQSHRREIVVE